MPKSIPKKIKYKPQIAGWGSDNKTSNVYSLMSKNKTAINRDLYLNIKNMYRNLR